MAMVNYHYGPLLIRPQLIDHPGDGLPASPVCDGRSAEALQRQRHQAGDSDGSDRYRELG